VFHPEFERQLFKLEYKYHEYTEKTTDWKRLAQYEAAASFTEYEQLFSYWHLHSLAVDPQHQRKGIATKLLKEGLDIAQGEQLPVTLEASVTGRVLYSKLGFKLIATHPIYQGVEAAMMFWEPQGSTGKWLEFGEDDWGTLRKDIGGSKPH
jgi:ribosomal protein S18 acetylase RimI-like enzyme